MQERSTGGRPAIFLDRDGTIIEEAGYIGDTCLVKFFPFTVSVLSELQKHFLLFIVTNQSGVSKGLTTFRDVESVNRYITDYLCASDYNIDLGRSFIIGDHPSDIECGINAGVTPLYLLKGHGERHHKEIRHDVTVCRDLQAASALIINELNNI